MAEETIVGQVDRLMQDVTSMISDKMGDVIRNLGELKKFRTGEDIPDGVVQNNSFAEIVKKAVKEVSKKNGVLL